MTSALLKTDTAMDCALGIARSLQIIRRAQQYESYRPHGVETLSAALEQIVSQIDVLAASVNALLREHRTDSMQIQVDVTRESDIMAHPVAEWAETLGRLPL